MRQLRYLIITCGALALFCVGSAALSGLAWTAGKASDKLQDARAGAAARAFTLHAAQHKAGRGTLDGVYRWSLRWRGARQGKATDAAHLKRMKKLAAEVKIKFAAGSASAADAAAARYYVAEAKLWASGGR